MLTRENVNSILGKILLNLNHYMASRFPYLVLPKQSNNHRPGYYDSQGGLHLYQYVIELDDKRLMVLNDPLISITCYRWDPGLTLCRMKDIFLIKEHFEKMLITPTSEEKTGDGYFLQQMVGNIDSWLINGKAQNDLLSLGRFKNHRTYRDGILAREGEWKSRWNSMWHTHSGADEALANSLDALKKFKEEFMQQTINPPRYQPYIQPGS